MFLYFECFPARPLGIKGLNGSELTCIRILVRTGRSKRRKLFAFLEGRTQVYYLSCSNKRQSAFQMLLILSFLSQIFVFVMKVAFIFKLLNAKSVRKSGSTLVPLFISHVSAKV